MTQRDRPAILGAKPRQSRVQFEKVLRSVLEANAEIIEVRHRDQLRFKNLCAVDANRIDLSGLRLGAAIPNAVNEPVALSPEFVDLIEKR